MKASDICSNVSRSVLGLMCAILLFTGSSYAQFSWHEAAPAVVPPSGTNNEFSMVYDAARGFTLLRSTDFSGGTNYLFDGVDWQSMTTATEPNNPQGAAMAYDSARAVVVLHGGFGSSDTWEYDGADWILRTSAGPAIVEGRMAFDASTGNMVLFGGLTLETWEYDSTSFTWTLINSPIAPSVFNQMAMDYDPAVGKIILFGGQIGDPIWAGSDETWSYDGATQSWTQLSPSNSPSARRGLHGVYSSTLGGLVIHGGIFGGTVNSDTWVYDAVANDWIMLAGAAGPALDASLLSYDSSSNSVILFGGWEGAPVFSSTDDTWVLLAGIPPVESFIRGNCNGLDSGVNIADAIFLLGNLFPSGGSTSVPSCSDACDANDDGALNIADVIALLGSLFGSPVAPLPAPNVDHGCGQDTTFDSLDCLVDSPSC